MTDAARFGIIVDRLPIGSGASGASVNFTDLKLTSSASGPTL